MSPWRRAGGIGIAVAAAIFVFMPTMTLGPATSLCLFRLGDAIELVEAHPRSERNRLVRDGCLVGPAGLEPATNGL